LAPVGHFHGRAWRQTALRVPGCLPPEQPAPHAGRYHRPGDPWPLYASLDRATMWAELAHATDGAVPPPENPRWVCSLDVDLRVLDLRDAATRRALRTSLAALTAPWSPDAPNRAAQRAMRAARSIGVDGLIVPSAAQPGGWNLVVLPPAFDRVRLRSRRRQAAPAG
jgi:RES domain-containing protein